MQCASLSTPNRTDDEWFLGSQQEQRVLVLNQSVQRLREVMGCISQGGVSIVEHVGR